MPRARRTAKLRRRTKGDHALRWRPDKGLFQLEAELPRAPGERRQRRTVYGKTEVNARRKLADLIAKGGGTIAPIVHVRVSEYVERWLLTLGGRLKPKTLDSYEWAWGHAKPIIGNIRFDQFTRKTALQLFEALESAGAGANTVRHVARVMQTAFESAIAESAYDGDHGGNPFKMVAPKKPQHRTEKGRALSVAEAQQFIKAAREDDLEAAWTPWPDGWTAHR